MKTSLLLAICIAAAVTLALLGPIAQPASYHHFADRRTIAGVPNFADTVSSLGFVVPALTGAWMLRRAGRFALRPAYAALFLAMVPIAAGSVLYHLAPSDATLLWDRLPMSVAFMAFLAIVVGEHRSARAARLALPWLLAAGVLSVLAWAWNGDLRAYALVQFLPLLLTPAIALLYPARAGRWHGAALLLYALAKAAELADAPLYAALGVSGHTLKHLLAAAGVAVIADSLRRYRRDS